MGMAQSELAGRITVMWTVFLAIFALAACEKSALLEARYSHDQCKRLTLLDGTTGEHLRGAEDFALDLHRGLIFVSAYDRRAVEKAVRKKAMTLPQGGVYRMPLNEIFTPGAEVVSAAQLIAPGDIAGGLRPHGISYDAANDEIVFINRAYQRINGRWNLTPHLQRVGAKGEPFVGEMHEARCAANDVLVTDQQVLTSFDHGACDWRAAFEDVLNLKRSGVVSNHAGAVLDNVSFANGLALIEKGEIALAATRENALVLMRELSDGVTEEARIALPGGPDNLTVAADGAVVAAVHPSLWRLALTRRFGWGRAPSRIVKADPATGAVEILFDDPQSRLFSAATVAVETEVGLVAGSVTDKGLLVCRREAQ